MKRRGGVLAVISVLAVVILTAVPGTAAPWDPVWERTVDPDTGPLILPSIMGATADGAGNVYITGTVAIPGGRTAMTLRKLDRDGAVLWRRTWHSRHETHPFAVGSDVTLSPDGRIVYVGGAQMNDSTEDSVARVWSFTASGGRRWTKLAWPGRQVGSAFVTSVAAGARRLVVGGHTWGECGPINGLVAAFTLGGERRWFDDFEPQARADVGDQVEDVALGGDGTIYAVGSLDTSVTTCGTDSDTVATIQARRRTGRIDWTRSLPAAGRSDTAMTLDAAGDHLFVGGERSAPRRAWLARMSARGRVVWSRTWGPAASRARVVACTASPWDALYVVGRSDGVTWLRRFTPSGQIRSVRRLVDGHAPTDVATGGALRCT